MYSLQKDTLVKDARVKRLKFSSDKLENSYCSICSLSLLRKDANLSKVEARNLYESINYNFTQFFLSTLILSTCFVNEIHFSLIVDKRQHVFRGGNFLDDEMRVIV